MSTVKLKTKERALATAIRELRQALGDTQEGMARRLGCTLSGYIQWEKGRRVPGGDWLLKLMALCPDEDTRGLFEQQIESYREQAGPPRRQAARLARVASTTPEQRRQAKAIAREAIEILYELGQAGFRPADQKLRQFADELSRVAGDFSRAFPRPK
jgi:transcriptional regulator with XRE-family HTH domain